MEYLIVNTLVLYQCDEFERKFQSRTILALHKKKHIPAFKCDHCSYKGISLKNLQVHKLKTHLQDSFSTIGLKRDHNMVPKSILSSGNSPPRKFKKTKTNIDSNTEFPTEIKNVPGVSGWSLGRSKEDKTTKN